MNEEKNIIRERIISAAMKIFSEYGFFKAPVHLIAKEAGVSKGLVFWYFRDKRSLIVEVAKRSLPLDVIDACLNMNLKGRSLLECIGNNYINKYRDKNKQSLLLHTLALETLIQEIADDIKSLCEEKINIIAENVFEENSIKAKVALRLFFGGLMCYTLRKPKDIDDETFLNNLLDITLSIR